MKGTSVVDSVAVVLKTKAVVVDVWVGGVGVQVSMLLLIVPFSAQTAVIQVPPPSCVLKISSPNLYVLCLYLQ